MDIWVILYRKNPWVNKYLINIEKACFHSESDIPKVIAKE